MEMVEIVHWHILKFIVLSSQPTLFSACLENPYSFFHVNAYTFKSRLERKCFGFGF